jgi:hypothetical protein
MWALDRDMVLVVDRDAVDTVVPVRRCIGRRGGWLAGASSSDGEDDDASELGGDASSAPPPYTRAHGARVRSVGPLSGRLSLPDPSFPLSVASWRRGRVSAQLSHGPARLVTYSS